MLQVPIRAQTSCLPFVQFGYDLEGDRRTSSFWNVRASHVWAVDDQIGREYGRLFLNARQARVPGTPPLSMIMRDMVKAGRWTGVEAGFNAVIEGEGLGRDNDT